MLAADKAVADAQLLKMQLENQKQAMENAHAANNSNAAKVVQVEAQVQKQHQDNQAKLQKQEAEQLQALNKQRLELEQKAREFEQARWW